MKKLTALFTAIILIAMSVLSVSATAVTDYRNIINEFEVNTASNGMKYASYSPVKDANDITKYPLVIYIHGLFHGWTDSSFVKSGLTYWASDEMQSLFNEGGAYLLMPKIPEPSLTWFQTKKVMNLIVDYVNSNIDSIDTNQIYIMGGSAGGALAWNLIIQSPDYFAKAVLLCAAKAPSATEVQKVADIPIWEVSALTDPLINYGTNQKPTWDKICKYSNVKAECRWTVFNTVTLPDGSHPLISHFLAKTIGNNFATFDGNIFTGMSTVNANGETVMLSFNDSLVQWLQR